MTWNPNNPLSSDKIRAWPNAVTTSNWPQLQTMISADHQFNNTPAAGDNSGFHKVARWVLQAGALGDNTPAIGTVVNTPQFYSKALTYRKAAGAASTRQVLMQQPGDRATAAVTLGLEETAIGAAPIKAAVSFDTAGTILGAAFNVTSVASIGAQAFLITYVVNMPNDGSGGTSCFPYIVVGNITGGTATNVRVVAKTRSTCTVQVFREDGAAATGAVDLIVLGGWNLT